MKQQKAILVVSFWKKLHLGLIFVTLFNYCNAQENNEKFILLNVEFTQADAESKEYWIAVKKKEILKISRLPNKLMEYNIISAVENLNSNIVWNELRGLETLGCCVQRDPNDGVSLMREDPLKYKGYFDEGGQLLAKKLPFGKSRLIEHVGETSHTSIRIWNVKADLCKCIDDLRKTGISNSEVFYYLKNLIDIKRPCRKVVLKIEQYLRSENKYAPR